MAQRLLLDVATALNPVKLAGALLSYIPHYKTIEFPQYHELIDITLTDESERLFFEDGFELFGDENRTRDVIGIATSNMGFDGPEDLLDPRNLYAAVDLLRGARERGYIKSIPSSSFGSNGEFHNDVSAVWDIANSDRYPLYRSQRNGRSILIGPDDSLNALIHELALVASGRFSAIFSSKTLREKCTKHLGERFLIQESRDTRVLKAYCSSQASNEVLRVNDIFRMLDDGLSIKEATLIAETAAFLAVEESEAKALKNKIVMFWPRVLGNVLTTGISGSIEWCYHVYRYARKKATSKASQNDDA